MTPDNNIAICVVGCGNWGRNHIRTLHEFGILGGIVDSNEETLKNLKITYPSILFFDTVLTQIKSITTCGFDSRKDPKLGSRNHESRIVMRV